MSKDIPKSCRDCPYTFEVERKYGKTTHCEKEPTNMDITYHVSRGTRTGLCPLSHEQNE